MAPADETNAATASTDPGTGQADEKPKAKKGRKAAAPKEPKPKKASASKASKAPPSHPPYYEVLFPVKLTFNFDLHPRLMLVSGFLLFSFDLFVWLVLVHGCPLSALVGSWFPAG